MQQRIFHQRLQRKRRHHRVRCWSLRPLHAQAIGKAHEFDVEIATGELEFLRECNHLSVAGAQCGAQQIGEPHDELLRQGRVSSDERDNRVQRVEEEVRIELGLQCAQLRLRQVFAHARCEHAPRLPLLIPAHGHLRHDDGADDDQKHVTVRTDADDQRALEAAGLVQSERDGCAGIDKDLYEHNRRTQQQVHHQGTQALARTEWDTVTDIPYQRRP